MRRVSTLLILVLACPLALAGRNDACLEDAILDLVNDPATTQAQLEHAVTLGYYRPAPTGVGDYVREEAALAILNHRAGPDGVYGTADDDPFDSLLELYETSGVGTESMEGLEIYAYQRTGLCSAILDLANEASQRKLERRAGLSTMASRNIVCWRDGGLDHVIGTGDDKYVPYGRIFGTYHSDPGWQAANAHSVDDVPYVTPEQIQKLYDFSMLSGKGGR